MYKNVEDRNAYARKWAAENRERHGVLVARNKVILKEWWKSYKSTLACIKCGENHPHCLDFHHRDPAEKEFTLSLAGEGRYGIPRLLKEVAKCDVLCANCHRKLHAALNEKAKEDKKNLIESQGRE